LALPAKGQGYCVCYQHDVNEYGYGPYGFRSEAARNLLSHVFEPLIYWDDSRRKMFDVRMPNGGGLYFYKHQPFLEQLENEVSNYQKAIKLQSLRDRYGKLSAGAPVSKKPLVYDAYEGGKIRVAVISDLLKANYKFFFIYPDLNLGDEVFVFFDSSMRKK
jgi:hypothetical protein